MYRIVSLHSKPSQSNRSQSILCQSKPKQFIPIQYNQSKPIYFIPTNSTNPQNLVVVRNTRLRNPYESWKSQSMLDRKTSTISSLHINPTYQHVYITTLASLVHVVHPQSNLRKNLLPFRDICEHCYACSCWRYLLVTHYQD
jgi:hypothetical protein